MSFEFFVGSLVSALFGSLTLVMFVMLPPLRKHPAGIFMWRVLCTLTVDSLYIVSYATDATEDVGDSGSVICTTLAFINQFASFAGDLW